MIDIKEIVLKIKKIDNLEYKDYFFLCNEYGKDNVLKSFNIIFDSCNKNEVDDIKKKYYIPLLEVDLEKEKICKSNCFKLIDKYGEDNIIHYFRNLLIFSNNSEEIRNKYILFYSYIGNDIEHNEDEFVNMENSCINSDPVKQYLNDINNYHLFTPEEEKMEFEVLNKCKGNMNISYLYIPRMEQKLNKNARIEYVMYLVFNSFDKVLLSICDIEQIKKLSKINKSMRDSDKKLFSDYLKVYRSYFLNNDIELNSRFICEKIDINMVNDLYTKEYLDKELDNILLYIRTKNKIVESNLKLVANIAKRYAWGCNSLNYLDLISEGNIGLIRAVDRFDISMGFKFSTYATWWIKQSISRSIPDKDLLVRLPVHTFEDVKKIKATIAKLEATNNVITDDMIAEVTKLPIDKVYEIRKIINSGNGVSLDMHVGEDDDATLGDFVATDDISPEIIYEGIELKESLYKALNTLTEKERNVLYYRFGLDNGRGRTLEEVGQMYGVTRERIRQIEGKALRKLRHPSRSQMISDYLNDN